MAPHILVFSGSHRVSSLNAMLARQGAKAIERAGGQATLIDLAAYSLPLYGGDVEAEHGIPLAAMELKRLFKSHHGFLIASPEYNASISPVLKNTIDWVSRTTPAESGKLPYAAKVAGLVGASPSPLGAYRGLLHLRQILTALGTWVMPDQLGIPAATSAFAADGTLRDAMQHGLLDSMAAKLVASAASIGTAI